MNEQNNIENKLRYFIYQRRFAQFYNYFSIIFGIVTCFIFFFGYPYLIDVAIYGAIIGKLSILISSMLFSVVIAVMIYMSSINKYSFIITVALFVIVLFLPYSLFLVGLTDSIASSIKTAFPESVITENDIFGYVTNTLGIFVSVLLPLSIILYNYNKERISKTEADNFIHRLLLKPMFYRSSFYATLITDCILNIQKNDLEDIPEPEKSRRIKRKIYISNVNEHNIFIDMSKISIYVDDKLVSRDTYITSTKSEILCLKTEGVEFIFYTSSYFDGKDADFRIRIEVPVRNAIGTKYLVYIKTNFSDEIGENITINRL